MTEHEIAKVTGLFVVGWGFFFMVGMLIGYGIKDATCF